MPWGGGAHAAQGVEVTGRTPQSGHSRSPGWGRDSGAGAHTAQGVEGDGQGTLEWGAHAAQDVEGVRGPSSSQKRGMASVVIALDFHAML